jgi:hypothetical protein
MASYVIRKKNKNNEIVYMEYSMPGYTFSPKKIVSYLNVKNIKVIDNQMSDNILSIKFTERFKKLLKLVSLYLNDDDASDSDTSLVLDEVSQIKSILLNKYQKFINNEKEELFLKKLRLIENEIKIKDLKIKEKCLQMSNQTEKGKSR